MRLKDKVAIVAGSRQTPGDTIGNGPRHGDAVRARGRERALR
jgi:hypothetical protein